MRGKGKGRAVRTVLPLPDYVRRVWLPGANMWGYYFKVPKWARKPKQGDDRGPCPVGSEPLGTDYEAAVKRAETVLLPLFHSWRTRGLIDLTPDGPRTGTLDWLFAACRKTGRYKKLGRKTKNLYEAGFCRIGNYVLKDGRRLGAVDLPSIKAGVVDSLYDKLLPVRDDKGDPVPLLRDGKPVLLQGEPVFRERRTTVNHAMKACRWAWNVAKRVHPEDVPDNPFAHMGLVGSSGSVTAATYGDLLAAVAQADAMGLPSLGTAMMLTWEWLQREEHIFTAFEFTHYRPKDHPNEVYVVHPKNGEAVWIPLFDPSGAALFPELMARMDAMKRDRVGGGPFFVRDWIDVRAGVPLPWATTSGDLRHASRKVKEVLKAAELDRAITFTSFRHGGLTELGDAELTDAQIRAISRHKSARVLPDYVKRTPKQIIDGTHKRRAMRPAVAVVDDQFELFEKGRK